jgi:AGCS family alanine or glycine:cation symporter
MYTLLHGLNFKTLAILFAAFTLIASFGIGNMVQANSVVDGLAYVFPEVMEYRLGIGVIIAILVGLVIIGGIRRIASVTSRIVPFMAIFYCGAALVILFMNVDRIPGAFATIFNLALNPWAAGGGAIGAAIQYGVARGVFSNEAGLGSAPMAHAAARTNEPAREGLVAMMGPFIDTIIICTMTALVIVIMGAWGEARPEGLEGAALSAYAFDQALGTVGSWIVGIGLVFFAYSTMIAWSYYGDRSAEFLFGERAILPYRIIFTVLVVVGAYVPLQLVWNFADIANILMAVPNLISLILLATLVKKLTDDYFSRMPD